jgi:predicted esterase
MKSSYACIVLAVSAMQCFACSAESPESAGKGGASGTSGAAGVATSDTAGTSVTSGGAGETSGSSGGSGGSSAGGSSGGAGSDSAGGSGGQGGAGTGGSVNIDGGSKGTPKPSAGCGKSGRPANGTVTVANDHIYTFPTSYDGSQPFPLLIGFHAASNPIEQIENLTNGSDFEKNYVRAFPKSAGTAWDYNTDMKKVLAMYDDLMASYCIDTSRVFSTGHSSGAQLIVQILTQQHKTDAQHFNFKAVAPVAASNYGAFSGPMPVMYIQGKKDMVRMSDGADTVARFTTANGCMMTSKAYAGPMCMSSGKTVNDGCVQYDGCTVPTIWCSHDDPQYSNTSHGWPCFATKAMYEFFAGLP